MRSVLRSLRSPGVVISILALVAAVAGAAVASPTASTSKLSKKDKKQVRKIADAEIAKLAPTLSVKSATTANSVTGAGGVTQKSLKSSAVVTIDYPSIAAQSCATVDSTATSSLSSLSNVAASDLIIATPDANKPITITFVAGSLAPFAGATSGVYFDACNPTAGAVNPPAFNVRVATIGA
jgi:hypothetical protein